MELLVDLDSVFIKLVDPQDLDRFQLTIEAPVGAMPATHLHRLGDVVAAQHVGVLRPDGDVSVDPALIRFLGAGQVDDGWEQGFTAMLSNAGSEGWLDEEGRIQAHVVWPENSGARS
jgi:hypothetical protein